MERISRHEQPIAAVKRMLINGGLNQELGISELAFFTGVSVSSSESSWAKSAPTLSKDDPTYK